MKKLAILLLVVCISNLSLAQWAGTNPVYFNNGSVGIGTSSPNVWFAASRLLQVEGSRPVLSLKSTGTLGTISFTNNQVSSSNRYGEFHLNHSFLITDPGKSTLGFWSYPGGNTLTLQADGNVGIGTNAPTSKLELLNGYQQMRLLTGTNTSGYMLDIGVNDDGVNLYNNSLSRGFNFSNATGTLLTVRHDGKTGIGTDAPDNTLHVEGDLLLDVFGNSGHEKGIFFREGFSTTNKYNVSILAYDHNGGGTSPDGLSINGFDGVSFNTGSDTRNESMRIAQNGNVGIGTPSPNEKLSVNGTIRSKKVKVDANGWPDYVFASSYELRALSEVENYIKENQHLPEVPSAQEVEINGLDLGSMDATLLKKVEELTLYTIDQQKKIDQQAKENQKLNDRLAKIEALLKTLTSK